MGLYKYIAKDKGTSTSISGTLEAQSSEDAQKLLHGKNLIIVSLREESHKSAFKFKRKAGGRVKIDDLVIFSRQLATLIDSGINLVTAMDILRTQTESRAFVGIISQIYHDIEGGKSFCDAVAKYPATFSEFFISMIKAGEASGMLNDVLERLATYLEKTAALRRKVISSLIYPAVIVTMAFLITSGLMLKVVPTFKGIFETLGGKLPLPTMILITISDIFKKYFFIVIGIMVGAAILFKKYTNTPKGRYIFDKCLLKLPLFGNLFIKVAVAKFSRTFSTLIKSGVPVLLGLDIVGKTSGNKVIEEAIMKCRESVRQGEPINQPLEKFKVFPPMVVRMIGVGEKTGELEKMLNKIATFYEEQVDTMVSGLTSIIEPVVIAFLGTIIGGIVLALFLPIFKISELVAK